MTIPLETDIAVAGVGRLEIQAGRVSMTLVALCAVVHPWLNWITQADEEEAVKDLIRGLMIDACGRKKKKK